MLSSKIERLLSEIYYDVNHPVGFANVTRLFNAVKKNGIRLKEVREFLCRQHSHQLTRPNHYNYPRRRTVSMG